MRTLFTGKGGAGSWTIRGEQLGAAFGADVEAQRSHFAPYDVVVVVKKATRQQEAALRKFSGLVVWDIVDNWPQKSVRTLSQARTHVQHMASVYGADACVFATDAMRASLDLEGFTLPHHARPDQQRNPIREQVRSVCYEGSPRYLVDWIEQDVRARGWEFAVNPPSLADHDIVISHRGAWRSEVTRLWKSNVKLANAQGSGTPCVLELEQGCYERDPVAPIYYQTREEFGAALDDLRPHHVRLWRSKILYAGAPKLADIARECRECVSKLYTRGARSRRRVAGS